MNRLFVFAALALTLCFFGTSAVYAQGSVFPTQLVPSSCGGYNDDAEHTPQPECNVCDFAQLIINVLNFLVAFSVVIATGLFVWAGSRMITAQDNSGQRDEAKGIFWNVVIGMVVVLGSWLFVDAIMKTFLADPNGEVGSFGPWNKILCPAGFQPAVQNAPETSAESTAVYTGSLVSASCTDCSPVAASCKNNCTLSTKSDIASRAGQFASDYKDLFITEAFPPTVDHCAHCQYDGTCFDATIKSGTYTAANMLAFESAAEKNNFRVVLETDDCSLKARALSSNIEARCKGQDSGYSHITGTHFSVYDRFLGPGKRDGPACIKK